MADYFSEYSSFIGAKGLPSPADTPYETPGFIRSKRSSRATAGSSREPSVSPPPLPPDTIDYQERSRDGMYSALDPRRFTPTLHASLVSEILNLRRELDSKNNLVENLEINLSTTKTDNDTLNEQLSEHAREVRKANQQVQQMEKGTYDAVQDLVHERDAARHNVDDLRVKLEVASKKTRWQDEDAVRTQAIWEHEKESWDNERRQLERRIHVTDNRLRTFVDEVSSQQAAVDAQDAQVEEEGDESIFKDSGLGNESDTVSIQSSTPVKHRRNMSSLSYRTRSLRHSVSSRASAGTPDLHARPNGYSLADELGIDEEDEYDMDDFEHADDELEYPEPKRRTVVHHSRQGSIIGELDSKAKRVLGLTSETLDSPVMAPMRSPTKTEFTKRSVDSKPAAEPYRLSMLQTSPLAAVPPYPELVSRVEYVDSGYQPSPPPSPQSKGTSTDPVQRPAVHEPQAESRSDRTDSVHTQAAKHALQVSTGVAASPISPPETPVIGGVTWPEGERMSLSAPSYSVASTQTDLPALERPRSTRSKRDSLSPPMFVPAIAIHPPTSRPASPRAYVLPPGTRNASAQVCLPWPGKDACIQTEEIRVDKRLRRLPSHLLPTRRQPSQLLPSPTLSDHQPAKKISTGGTAIIFTQISTAPSLPSPPLQSPMDSSPERTRENGSRDLRSFPLRAITLPRPVLAPAEIREEKANSGPLNRSSQYGVTRPLQSSQLLDIDKDSDNSDYDDPLSDVDVQDLTGSIPAFSRAPHGRFGLSQPPKVVPEDKEISPERRPGTAESYGAAPAPSVASSRANSQRAHAKPPAKLNAYSKDVRPRSPSFGSVASSSYSTHSVAPPFPIPTRSSSRVLPNTHSEGSQSPTPHHGGDIFGRGGHRSSRTQHVRQNSLRKVQSAAVIRQTARARTSPQKIRRRRRSPDLTPVQSMAFEDPRLPTGFSIPELPTPLQEAAGLDITKGSVDLDRRPSTAATSDGRSAEEATLVDSIAATMVGEWMWKYIRKRKSFGIGEDNSETVHGTRHKRWVWLSPYERTIMWDNKQPTSGSALLGKKGRKLTIQSVLDVQDDTPMPKGAELRSAYHRSILILTPQRALKFTAITQDRHAFWMTALSFLAQSGRLPAQFPPQMPSKAHPPLPTRAPPIPPKSQPPPAFGRATIRDSVRLAQGRRPSLHQRASQPGASGGSAMIGPEMAGQDQGADFPSVPRLYISTTRHQRKRSNTSPRLPAPLINLRSFSSSAIPSSASSRLHPGSTNGSSIRADLRSSSSKSGSRRDSITSPDRPNFFEAVGTVRMEAFVDPHVRNGVLYVPAPPPASAVHGPRRRRGDSNLSTSTVDKRRAGYVFDENGVDPFKGF
ncbi:hypothetical protein LTR36_003630 [Oleoguttula mirabilis]|uniref:Pleckstrin homology domain-containing protein n=1 Tax=Oleoguttula mirabilis TaxID=1507867 RepID=A0AAV9JJE9_9PEZI|nr:hypothetical protein LTR36_003630 [Oleoguttula mirabilis]